MAAAFRTKRGLMCSIVLLISVSLCKGLCSPSGPATQPRASSFFVLYTELKVLTLESQRPQPTSSIEQGRPSYLSSSTYLFANPNVPFFQSVVVLLRHPMLPPPHFLSRRVTTAANCHRMLTLFSLAACADKSPQLPWSLRCFSLGLLGSSAIR